MGILSTYKRIIVFGCLLSVIMLMTVEQSYGIDLFGTKKEEISGALELLPPEIRARWEALLEMADSTDISEYIVEGERVLDQLSKLIVVFGGVPPKPGDASYPVYVGVLNNLVNLLDRIEMAAVLIMTDDDELSAIKDEYSAERMKLQEDIRDDRQKLIRMGNERLREHIRDPEYRKQSHRRAVVADLYFRLAELMYQEAVAKRDEEAGEWIKLLEEDAAAAMAMGEPRLDITPVLEMYQHILEEFGETQYGIDALYNVAFLMSESSDPTERATANQYFETLVELYPGNKYTLNALLKTGDYYFNPPVNDPEKAIMPYTKVVENFPQTTDYVHALYKLGWCYYKISDLTPSVEYFAKTLDTYYQADGTRRDIGVTREKDFSHEAIRYIGVCFSVPPGEWESAGVEGLVAWFNENPDRLRNYGPAVIDTLADIYANIFVENNRGQYNEGVEAYEKFLELFPLHPKAWEEQRLITEIYRREYLHDPDRNLEEPIRFWNTYNPDSDWWAVNTDPQIRNKIIPVLEEYLDEYINRILVLGVGETGQENHPEYLEEFEEYARQYIRFWPNGPEQHTYLTHFNLAFVLYYKMDRPAEAMREFWQVATIYDNKEDMEKTCESLVKITMEFAERERKGEVYVSDDAEILPPEAAPPREEYVELEVEEAPADTGGISALFKSDVKRTPLLNSERLEMSAFDLYLDNFPNGRSIQSLLYEAGRFLYEHDWIPESRPYLERFLKEFPESKFYEDAYTRLLQGYYRTFDLAGVEDVAGRIMEANVAQELKDAAYQRKAVSIFRNASSLLKDEDHIAAADEFVRVATATPNWSDAHKALFQAGQEYANGGAFEKSNEAYLMLVERYSSSEFADIALYNTACNLMNELQQLEGAAETYERLADEYPGSKYVQDALGNASFNFDKVNDPRSVIRVNEKILARFPDDPEADVFLFEMAKHYLALDDFDSANRIYLRFAEQYPDDPRTIRAYYERGSYYLGKDDRRSTEREFRNVVAAHDRQVAADLPGNSGYASKALSKLLAWDHVEYDKLRFKLPLDRLRKDKARKKALRDTLIAGYNKLTGLIQKEGWQAYYAVGRLFEEEASVIYEQEVPHIAKQDSAFNYFELVVVDSSIFANDAAIANYKVGFERLGEAETNLILLQKDFTVCSDSVKVLIIEIQSDTAAFASADSATAAALSDSIMKLNRTVKQLNEQIAELDTSIAEAKKWKAACNSRIPELTVKPGDYLREVWLDKFNWENTETVPVTRMLYREEILKQIIVPMAPEVLGYYLQAIETIQETGIDVDYWIGQLDERFTHVIDTLLVQWDEQLAFTANKLEGYVREYDTMLPKGAWAESREGYLLDMMIDPILEWGYYLDLHNRDKLKAFTTLLDTIITYDLPVGFGGDALGQPLAEVLEWYDLFAGYSDSSLHKKEVYIEYYDENPMWYDAEFDEEIPADWWLRASEAYGDIAIECEDYGIGLLAEGLRIRDEYTLSGLAGIDILRKLVELKPDEYASRVGIQPQHFSLTSSTEWLIWPVYETGFEQALFDDSGWEKVHVSFFPEGIDFGILDSLRATPIWYTMMAPPVPPEWQGYPDEVLGREGELIEFTVIGDAPERGAVALEEWDEEEWEEEEELEEEVIPEEGEAVEPKVPETPPAQLRIEYYSENIPPEARFVDHGDGSGTFTWTPSFVSSGEYSAMFTLYNYNIPISMQVPIIVENVDRGFGWTEIPDRLDSEEGLILRIEVAGEDPDGDPLTIDYRSDDIPGTAVFMDNGDGTGLFTWETTYDDSGTYTASFSLNDGLHILEHNVIIWIANGIRAPKWIDFPERVEEYEGSVIEFPVAGSSPGDMDLTLADVSEGLPEAALFLDHGDGSGTFTWATTYEDAGSYTLTLEMSNVDTTVGLEISIEVLNATRAPRWVDFPEEGITVEEGGLVEFPIAGMHPDNLMMEIIYFSENIPEAAPSFVDNGDGSGTFSWQTAVGDEGVYTASFILSDVDTSIDCDVQIAVGRVAQPPEWTYVPVDTSVEAGSLLEFTIAGADPGGNPVTFEYSSDDLPDAVEFVDNGNGTALFSWQTTAEDGGDYKASFTLSDGEASMQNEVSITVAAVDRAPEWTDEVGELLEVNEGELLEFTVIGTDPDGDELAIDFSPGDLPAAEPFIDMGDGSGLFSWQPSFMDGGSYTVRFVLRGGDLTAEERIITIRVNDVDQPPEWIEMQPEYSGDEGSSIAFTVIGMDLDGDSMTIKYIPTDLPESARFVDGGDGTGTFSWQTTYEDGGTYRAIFILQSNELSAEQSATITVNEAEPPADEGGEQPEPEGE